MGKQNKKFTPEHAREKWEWFHSEHPNSQLWMKKELKEFGILPIKRAKLGSI